MRYGRNVGDRGDCDAYGFQRSYSGFASGAGAFDENFHAAQSVFFCHESCLFASLLSGKGSAFSRTAESERACAFMGECTEVGMYIAMSRQADRDGYPEIAEAFKRYALEEAEHAAKFAELLGEVVYADTKKNLELRAAAEQGACMGKKELATRAKELGYDAIHDTVHEMAKDEARHGRGFDGLLKRYFSK